MDIEILEKLHNVHDNMILGHMELAYNELTQILMDVKEGEETSDSYDEDYFDWLRSVGELDRYEAMLDISVDYAGCQKHRLSACDDLDKLRTRYTSK